MKKIGYIALDDRPCNYMWPQKLLKNTKVQLLSPPREIMGRFNTPGDRSKMAQWLRDNVSSMDGLVLSIDMMVYGGLIASRRLDEEADKVIERLKVIEELKSINPNLVIYAFSVLMRTSITVDSAESQKNWEYIFEYSKLHYQITQLKHLDLEVKLKELEKLIPEDILNTYLKTRKRNFTVNMAVLDFVENGCLDFIAFCQEDAAEYGLHREEQAGKLRKSVRKRDLIEKIEVVTGTDELGSLLLTKFINYSMDKIPRVFVDYTFDEGRFIIAPYEDCCLDISVGEHIRLSGALQGAEPEKSDIILLCHNNKDNPTDLFKICPEKFEDTGAGIFIKKLKKYIKYKKPVAIADVYYANGGDPALITELVSQKLIPSISSYSAMNTTSNTVGISLSQVIQSFVMKFTKKRKCDLIIERILDDCYYQTIVRPHLNSLITQKGLIPVKLPDDEVEFFQEELQKKLLEYFKYIIGDKEIKEFKAYLPWGRTFEVEVDFLV